MRDDPAVVEMTDMTVTRITCLTTFAMLVQKWAHNRSLTPVGQRGTSSTSEMSEGCDNTSSVRDDPATHAAVSRRDRVSTAMASAMRAKTKRAARDARGRLVVRGGFGYRCQAIVGRLLLSNLFGLPAPAPVTTPGVACPTIAAVTCATVLVGFSLRKSAATPTRCGVAIDVPEMMFVATSLVFQLDLICDPGANRSTQAPKFE